MAAALTLPHPPRPVPRTRAGWREEVRWMRDANLEDLARRFKELEAVL